MRVCAAPRATASAVSARAHAPSSRSRAARATAAAAKCDPAARARAAASAPRCALRTRRSSALRASAAKDDLDLDFDVDEDDDYPGVGFGGGAGRAGAGSASRWAVEEADISISPSARAAAAAAHAASADPANRWRDAEADDVDDREERWDDLGDGWSEARNDRLRSFDETSDAFGDERGERGAPSPRSFSSGAGAASPSWADEDIIADGGAAWFENDEDWYEPEYAEVNAPEGSVLEKVQRLHLREPKDFSFEDGEYFDLTGFVKDNTDNQFALVLEVAERARERRVEHLEALHPTPASAALPPIQQAIVDLALEVEASGGRTSAFSAMREAADRARLRWELQEAAWAWDNYCEDRMEALGVSERAARLLHMGQRVEDAMDFEKDLNLHEEDYNAKPPRS